MKPVTVQFYKQWGQLHWRHDMFYLGEDEHGVWLGASAGSTVQKGHEPPRQWPHAYVQLIAPEAWWTIVFNGRLASNFRQYVDIVEPARWVGDGRVEMVDLDIDVIENMGGEVMVLDQDEFDGHAVEYGYPPDLIDGAERARDAVRQTLIGRQEPFYRAGERWLERVAK
jgi:protein associated with RNAse G/E